MDMKTTPPRFDEVPSMPLAPSSGNLHKEVADLREIVHLIKLSARQLEEVSAATTMQLNKRQKIAVAVAAGTLVGIGVGGTLLVQKIANSRSKKVMPK